MNSSSTNPSEMNNIEFSSSDNRAMDASAGKTKGEGNSRRGFASMTPERRREVASNGGRTAHQQGVAHKWTQEEASQAGKKSQSLRRTKG